MPKFRLLLLVIIGSLLAVVQPVHAQTPRIVSFKALASPVTADGQVTIMWETQGFRYVRLFGSKHSATGGNTSTTQDVPASGSLTFPVSELAILTADNTNELFIHFSLYVSNKTPPNWEDLKILRIKVDLGMSIAYFKVTPNNASAYDTLNIAWSVPGASYVKLDIPIPSNKRVMSETARMNATGTYSYTITPDDLARSRAMFGKLTKDPTATWQVYLSAYSAVRPDAPLRELRFVQFRCGLMTPFWGKAADCPSTAALNTAAAREKFERGFMLWDKASGLIAVVYNDGTWRSFEDTWQEGETVATPDAPPAGRFAPVRGFGKIWITDKAVRQGLGWALEPERSYQTTYQSYGQCKVYTLPDNQALFLNQRTARWAFEPAICAA